MLLRLKILAHRPAFAPVFKKMQQHEFLLLTVITVYIKLRRMKELQELRERKYVGTAQLADEAARLVLRFVPRQERQSVSPVPDERTVRYYTTEGLLSP